MTVQAKFKETEIGKIPEDWGIKKVEDFCEKITSGGTPSRRIPDYWKNGTIPWLKTQELLDNNIYNTEEKITNLGFKNSSAKFFPPNTVIMAMYGATVGKLAVLKVETTTNQACCAMIPNERISNHKFLFYALLNYRGKIINLACGAAQQNLNQDIIKSFKLPFPPKMEQDKIASILSSLDDEIALNRSMNSTLEAIGQALFRRWFVELEFPNEEGKPYRSSGGAMVDSELGEVPRGWRVGMLGDIIENFDSKRIPLSSRERALKKGIYPYYGAASIMDYVEDYIFDGIYILMGEDGTVIDENEHPILQYVWGKFWVNNHAHVIQGKNGIPMEYILLLLKQMNIKHLITGAVQPKINQGNMNSLTVIIPPKETLNSFSKLITPLFEKYRVSSEEVKSLSVIRDALLPKLMSGEIRVKVE